jgi:hypothetical protein
VAAVAPALSPGRDEAMSESRGDAGPQRAARRVRPGTAGVGHEDRVLSRIESRPPARPRGGPNSRHGPRGWKSQSQVTTHPEGTEWKLSSPTTSMPADRIANGRCLGREYAITSMSTFPTPPNDWARCTNRVPTSMGPVVTFSAETMIGLYDGSFRGSASRSKRSSTERLKAVSICNSCHRGTLLEEPGPHSSSAVASTKIAAIAGSAGSNMTALGTSAAAWNGSATM